MGDRAGRNEGACAFIKNLQSRSFVLIWLLQARIALLEGERRSFENVKLDLMRRIKMLEYALRMERCVSVIVIREAHIDVSRDQFKTTHSAGRPVDTPCETGVHTGADSHVV